ncbi:MAG TPA: aminopeptidase P family protein [Acidimicrobiia bacterium]|nr:aminopeptidase P family protein [Acidimicrobiia bacterium]
MNHAARLDSLRDRLDRALLVGHAPNLHYLTGFTGSLGYLFVPPEGEAVFITDGRYGELAQPLVAALGDARLAVSTKGLWPAIAETVAGHAEVALEAGGVTWEFATAFERETGITPSVGSGAVEEARRTKDADEIAALRAAAAAGDAAFARLGELVAGAATESELGWRLIDAMREEGAAAAGWEPIVAAGAGASIPHYRSGTKPLGTWLLLLDYGCTVAGYHSDMSRTVPIVGSFEGEMATVYRAVAESQQAGIDAIAPGVPCGDVDEACRAVLRSYGYEEHFLHSTGHGVGLEIHEAPWLRRGNDDRLRAGDVVTVEPGVYLPGVGGVRIEDMVLVTPDGPDVLTRSSREPTLP